MPTPTYEAIATFQLTANTASVTFSSIPQTYTDLILVGDVSSGSNAQIRITNINAAVAYEALAIRTTTSSATTAVVTSETELLTAGGSSGSVGATTISSVRIEFFNYSLTGTSRRKPILYRIGRSGSAQAMGTGVIQQATVGITQFTLSVAGTQFAAGSSLTLYGVA